MPLWTLWDKTKPPSQAVIKEHQATPGTANGELPIGLDESLAWLVETHDPQPTYDAQTQKLRRENGVVAIDPADQRTGTRTWGWSTVELTEAELLDAQRQTQLAADKLAVGVIAQKWLNDEEPIEQSDVAKVAQFIAIRDGLDAQAP